MSEARLLYGTTEPGHEHLSSDLLWRTGFNMCDPFFLCEFADGNSVILVSDLEYERAKKESRDCRVELLQSFVDKIRGRKEKPSLGAAFAEFLRDNAVDKVLIPHSFPALFYNLLSDGGFDVDVLGPETPFYPQRVVKTEWEIERISGVQRVVEEVVHEVVEILRKASIFSDGTLRNGRNRKITAESIRSFMDVKFTQRDCFAMSTIIACGDQAVDPHLIGEGPLYAHLPIVIDVYPRSKKHLYWSDMSRTFFKGEPTPEARKMYQTVLDAQSMAISMVRAGVDGITIQQAVEEFFKARDYLTGIQGESATMQGFIHSVGHGVGLDIHEKPYITRASCILPEGSLVTVEPGLYYLGIGGVRIEDLVVVTKDGCRNLTSFPKELSDMIIP
jgi:Xaa-Pro aminopeptidase